MKGLVGTKRGLTEKLEKCDRPKDGWYDCNQLGALLELRHSPCSLALLKLRLHLRSIRRRYAQDELTPHTVEFLLKIYDEFTNKPGGFKYRGHFTNAVNSYQQAFTRMAPSAVFTWNNIVKIGNAHAKGLPSETNLQWQDHWFDVIREEIRFLAPDVVLFFTGPRYDRFLKRVLPDLTFHAFRGLARA